MRRFDPDPRLQSFQQPANETPQQENNYGAGTVATLCPFSLNQVDFRSVLEIVRYGTLLCSWVFHFPLAVVLRPSPARPNIAQTGPQTERRAGHLRVRDARGWRQAL